MGSPFPPAALGSALDLAGEGRHDDNRRSNETFLLEKRNTSESASVTQTTLKHAQNQSRSVILPTALGVMP